MRAAIESQALRGATGDLAAMASEAVKLLGSQSDAIADGRLDDAAEADMRFHLRLAGSTENRPLRLLAEALIGRARQAAHAAYRVSAYRRASLRQHRSIVAALKAGDRDRAADLLMEHHLSRVDQLASYLERPPGVGVQRSLAASRPAGDDRHAPIPRSVTESRRAGSLPNAISHGAVPALRAQLPAKRHPGRHSAIYRAAKIA